MDRNDRGAWISLLRDGIKVLDTELDRFYSATPPKRLGGETMRILRELVDANRIT